ncbi:MAG: hypothetical protein LBU27_04655 [Candidatus Peribacteria bacterium]|jgi:hypothetical protein|nr:hypothetical protein [Candidatus Peribacteria bacterium]
MTPFNTTTSRESEEKLPSVVVATPNNQAIIITKTPEGIPFINESNKISIKDTQGETTLELDKNSHVCQYNNQKIAVQHNNAIYTSDALSQGFSKVPGLDGTEKIKFNERVFRKYGEVVASQGNGDTIKCLLNGKTYILPSNYNGLRVDF